MEVEGTPWVYGWDESGNGYWYNGATGESSWLPPVELSAAERESILRAAHAYGRWGGAAYEAATTGDGSFAVTDAWATDSSGVAAAEDPQAAWFADTSAASHYDLYAGSTTGLAGGPAGDADARETWSSGVESLAADVPPAAVSDFRRRLRGDKRSGPGFDALSTTHVASRPAATLTPAPQSWSTPPPPAAAAPDSRGTPVSGSRSGVRFAIAPPLVPTPPREEGGNDGARPGASARRSLATDLGADPDGWDEAARQDWLPQRSSTGRTYYWNRRTGESVWKPPSVRSSRRSSTEDAAGPASHAAATAATAATTVVAATPPARAASEGVTTAALATTAPPSTSAAHSRASSPTSSTPSTSATVRSAPSPEAVSDVVSAAATAAAAVSVKELRAELEALWRARVAEKTAEVELIRRESAEERARLSAELEAERDRARAEFARGHESATGEWTAKLREAEARHEAQLLARLREFEQSKWDALLERWDQRTKDAGPRAEHRTEDPHHPVEPPPASDSAAASAPTTSVPSTEPVAPRVGATGPHEGASLASDAEAAWASRLTVSESAAATWQQRAEAAEGRVAELEELQTRLEQERVALSAAGAAEAAEAVTRALATASERHRAELASLRAELVAQAEESRRAAVAAALAEERRALETARVEWETQASERYRVAVEAAVEEERRRTAARMAALEAERDEARAAWMRETNARRAAHNRLIELQGNIRVFVRVRPVLPAEEEAGEAENVVDYPDADALLIRFSRASARVAALGGSAAGGGAGSASSSSSSSSGSGSGSGSDVHRFDFDRVFAPASSQEEVCEDVLRLVTSVLDGFNVCIFAYGQTGTGKTFTMEGPPDNPGVNRRALRTLFDHRDERAKREKDATPIRISLSILEIHNETVRDLLEERDGGSGSGASGRGSAGSSSSSSSSSSLSSSSSAAASSSLDIRQARDGSMYVEGLTELEVSDFEAVLRAMATASRRRAVGAHSMNEHSSRSHLVVTVRVRTERAVGSVLVPVVAKLHLIDLAGSERVAKTAATGERLREAQFINKSLSALGDVVQALSQRQRRPTPGDSPDPDSGSGGGGGGAGGRSGGPGSSVPAPPPPSSGAASPAGQHVPYRNSKLTYLLQDSLAGGSKVLMFVNISPALYNAHESLCSLKFAQRCRTVQLGAAKPARLPTGHDRQAAEAVVLRERVRELEARLAAAEARK